MVRAYIYLISFKNSNDIYIGKTKNKTIMKRFSQHKGDSSSTINTYVRTNLNGDWSSVDIDIIDSVDMDEDLTHLINHPSNTFISRISKFKKYTGCSKSNEELLNSRLAYTEYFHIHNYNNDGKYNVINKMISNRDVYDVYKFYNYSSYK
jgi:hypothetical protein